MKRKQDGSSASHAEHISQVERRLAAVTSAPKVAIATIITKLFDAGLLAEGFGGDSVEAQRKRIGKAATKISQEQTPYGPIMQSMMLWEGFLWDYINPLALMFALTSFCPAFADMMGKCTGHEPLRLILFVDEFRPGNVLRPDAGRCTQNVLWCFAEWPDWYLSRSGAWLTFGCLRSTHVENIEGGMSGLMKKIVLTFVNPHGASFLSGIVITTPTGTRLCRATLCGILGDEKGMKEVFATKGYNGTRPCLHCLNLCQFLPADDESTLVGIDALPESLVPTTDDVVWEIVAKLRETAARGRTRELAELEKRVGVLHSPGGLLFDPLIQQVMSPIGCWLRDWMHVLFVGGVANIELQQCIGALQAKGIAPNLVGEFFQSFTVPKERGPVRKDWFTPARLGKVNDDPDKWRGFAGELLTILPIFLNFLDVAIAPFGILKDHIESFRLLTRLAMLLSLGPQGAAEQVDLIADVIYRHAVLFRVIYKDHVKPKFHYLFHIPTHARRVGRLLNCFVTERGHRITKTSANHIFKFYEATLAKDMLNHIFARAEDGTIFMAEHFSQPGTLLSVPLSAGRLLEVRVGSVAQLRCGKIHKGDVVMSRVGLVGSVVLVCESCADHSFWVLVHKWAAEARLTFRPSQTEVVAILGEDLLGALTWRAEGGLVKALPPNPWAIEAAP